MTFLGSRMMTFNLSRGSHSLMPTGTLILCTGKMHSWLIVSKSPDQTSIPYSRWFAKFWPDGLNHLTKAKVWRTSSFSTLTRWQKKNWIWPGRTVGAWLLFGNKAEMKEPREAANDDDEWDALATCWVGNVDSRMLRVIQIFEGKNFIRRGECKNRSFHVKSFK